jgi:sensor domain CHASE-containing protein
MTIATTALVAVLFASLAICAAVAAILYWLELRLERSERQRADAYARKYRSQLHALRSQLATQIQRLERNVEESERIQREMRDHTRTDRDPRKSVTARTRDLQLRATSEAEDV